MVLDRLTEFVIDSCEEFRVGGDISVCGHLLLLGAKLAHRPGIEDLALEAWKGELDDAKKATEAASI